MTTKGKIDTDGMIRLALKRRMREAGELHKHIAELLRRIEELEYDNRTLSQALDAQQKLLNDEHQQAILELLGVEENDG